MLFTCEYISNGVVEQHLFHEGESKEEVLGYLNRLHTPKCSKGSGKWVITPADDEMEKATE